MKPKAVFHDPVLGRTRALCEVGLCELRTSSEPYTSEVRERPVGGGQSDPLAGLQVVLVILAAAIGRLATHCKVRADRSEPWIEIHQHQQAGSCVEGKGR